MHIKVKLLLHRLISRVQRQTKNTTPTHGSLQNTFLCVVLLMSHYIYILFLQGPNTCRNSYCEFVFLLLINCQYFSTSSSTMFRKRDKLAALMTFAVVCLSRRSTQVVAYGAERTPSHTHTMGVHAVVTLVKNIAVDRPVAESRVETTSRFTTTPVTWSRWLTR